MRILVLSTWFPYPLSQGSKIRAYHLIKGLAQRHEVALLSFEDAPVKACWLDQMRQMCQKVETVPHNPFAYPRMKALLGWFSLRPSAVLASRSQQMEQAAQRLAAEWKPERIFAFTFVTAPYALAASRAASRVPHVVDVDNLMTPMLREEYQRSQRPLRRFRSWLACEKFQRYERWLYRQFSLGLVVSERDRRALIELVPLPASRVGITSNGVDTTYQRVADIDLAPNTLIFNGALTYAANYDAMDYFLREIFPLVRKEVPEARLKITGSTKGVPVAALPADDHVTFTGYVDDIRREVASSCVCVAPLRIGGGTRLKILEAMALGTPVVSTSKGAEGLDVEAGKHLLIADAPDEFAAQIVRLLRQPLLRQSLTACAAQLIREKYDWVKIGQHLCDLVESVENVERV